jgi:hypothetical protein
VQPTNASNNLRQQRGSGNQQQRPRGNQP